MRRKRSRGEWPLQALKKVACHIMQGLASLRVRQELREQSLSECSRQRRGTRHPPSPVFALPLFKHPAMVHVCHARHNHVRRLLSFALWSFLTQVIVATSSSNDTSTCDENSALSTRHISDSRRGGPPRRVTRLSQCDFENGTYRIRDSGRYILMEDIYFGPRPDNDYWPEPQDPNYPASQFYLGFFAGITVEADNVEIDLNGHTLAQNKEFYLLQRFWNAIELANRVFVDNEGVSSLNFQEGDKEQFQSGRVPAMRGARKVYIHDGTLGLSSHSGVHGNNASQVYIENVKVRDWEVSGVHLNGCRRCTVKGCEVGPTSSQVPARATFSNARFLELYTSRLIPLGFEQEGVLGLLNATISFADRGPQTLEAVFTRLGRAVRLFREHYMNRLEEASLSPEDASLLHDAIKIFAPRVPVPDGSVVYGMIFNHLGVPGDDENHYGAGEEAAEIFIKDTVVHELTIKPSEVAAILNSDGKFAQGPVRDLFRVLEVVSNRLRTLDEATYVGDLVHDAYLAMWQLANAYYEAQIYASGCGNFGSNATLPWAYDVGRCTQGVPQNPSLNGRDTVMLQKKYFGGLHLSEELYKWATTSGASLGDLFVSRQVSEDRYSSRHSLACDVDTMFHPMQGAIGVRLEEVRRVSMKNVDVRNLRNLGDQHGPTCQARWRLLANKEDIVPERSVADEGGGANARGLHVKVSQQVELKDVSITHIDSDEGFAIGIDIAPDQNDRSDYRDRSAVTFDDVRVDALTAGRKSMVARLGDDQFNMKEFKTGQPVDNGNWFKPPKLVIKQEIFLPTALVAADAAASLALLKSNTSYNTDEKARGLLLDGIAMLGNKYGIHFPDGYQNWPVSQLLFVPVEPDSFVVFGSFGDLEYTSTAVCVGTTCSKPPAGAIILDFFYVFVTGPSGITLNGTFGGNAGKFAPQGTAIVSNGLYVHRGLGTIDGLNPNGEDVEMIYYADCPFATINYPNPDGGSGSAAVSYINCIVENDILGRGRARGTSITYSDGENTSFVVQNALFFDDEWPDAPTGSGRITPPVPQPTFQREFQTDIVVFADGVLPVSRSRSGADILPYLFAHHYTHEAGIKFLRRWTSFKLDSEIRELRHSFLVALRDTFGIGLVHPDDWNDLPLHAQIDLGRGNTVVPYVVNHLSNQRALLKVLPDNGVEQLGLDSRMHEGGFRLLVGSSGLDTSAQHLPFGSLILQGVYVMENGSNQDIEITFRSKFPMITDPWSTLTIVQELHNPALGDGEARILVAESSPTAMGQKINIRGNFGFRGP